MTIDIEKIYKIIKKIDIKGFLNAEIDVVGDDKQPIILLDLLALYLFQDLGLKQ